MNYVRLLFVLGSLSILPIHAMDNDQALAEWMAPFADMYGNPFSEPGHEAAFEAVNFYALSKFDRYKTHYKNCNNSDCKHNYYGPESEADYTEQSENSIESEDSITHDSPQEENELSFADEYRAQKKERARNYAKKMLYHARDRQRALQDKRQNNAEYGLSHTIMNDESEIITHQEIETPHDTGFENRTPQNTLINVPVYKKGTRLMTHVPKNVSIEKDTQPLFKKIRIHRNAHTHSSVGPITPPINSKHTPDAIVVVKEDIAGQLEITLVPFMGVPGKNSRIEKRLPAPTSIPGKNSRIEKMLPVPTQISEHCIQQ